MSTNYWLGKIFHGLSNKILPCHGILCDMVEYFATSLNNIHMEEEYINNIP